jgi:O-methyltransferase/methyltransferase family protein
VTSLDAQAYGDVRRLRELIHGYIESQAVYAAARLGVADHLADGARDCKELARLTGAHERSLYRLMRALANAGVFREDEQGRFALTGVGERLRSDLATSLRSEVLLFGAEPYRAAADLLYSVRTGAPAFDRTFQMSHREYLSTNADARDIFNDAMTQMTAIVAAEAVRLYDFTSAKTIVDVGGGNGVFLATVLETNSRARGILYDLPHAIVGAEARLGPRVAARTEIAAGDAGVAVPAGADIYMMKSVLHLLSDDEACAILGHCRRAMRADGRVLVIERVVDLGSKQYWGKFVDLVMLAMTGGSERTEADYERLFAAAGLFPVRAVSLPSGFSIIEAAGVRPAASQR